MNIGEILVSAIVGPIETVATAKLVELLNTLKTKNPEAHKTALVALYPVVDVHLEGLVDKTKTKVDDAVVHALKAAIEQSAEAAGIELPNLDKGQPGD